MIPEAEDCWDRVPLGTQYAVTDENGDLVTAPGTTNVLVRQCALQLGTLDDYLLTGDHGDGVPNDDDVLSAVWWAIVNRQSTESSRAPTPAQGPSTTPLPMFSFSRRLTKLVLLSRCNLWTCRELLSRS